MALLPLLPITSLLLLVAFTLTATADEVSETQLRSRLERLGAHFQLLHFATLDDPDTFRLRIGEEWQGAEADLASLNELTTVSEAVLEGPRVTDALLERVVELPNLDSLTVKKAKITGAGLAHLKRLSKLQDLNLRYVPVGDSAVEHLAALDGLKVLTIYGGDLTPQGKASLETAFEGTAMVLDLRKGAFLGVSCVPSPAGCVISYVREDSAAAKGGLQQGDVLWRYNGKKVADFESLTSFIAQDSPGTEVEFKILRNNEIVTKQVTLGYWE
jgi:hypothetical protein